MILQLDEYVRVPKLRMRRCVADLTSTKLAGGACTVYSSLPPEKKQLKEAEPRTKV